MKHLIVGSGVVGQATGKWLVTNNEQVFFYDIKKQVLDKLRKQHYNVIMDIKNDDNLFDIIWICTAEWNTEKALKSMVDMYGNGNGVTYVLRSTLMPGTTKSLVDKYKLKLLAHNPEFLREKTAISDMFHPDRIVIGTYSRYVVDILMSIYKTCYCTIVVTDPTSSEVIKLASNCWLATQISYWNEIRKICKSLDVNPQNVANACTLDSRISSYGSAMFGTPYSGFCLPKDMVSFSNLFKERKLYSEFLHLVSKVNISNEEQK